MACSHLLVGDSENRTVLGQGIRHLPTAMNKSRFKQSKYIATCSNDWPTWGELALQADGLKMPYCHKAYQ